MNTNPDTFNHHKYLNLLTYRKDGTQVPTPVWFTQEGNVLYVRTSASSGKVKRIRQNPNVMVAPCNQRGVLLGTWIPAHASIAFDNIAVHVDQLTRKKYGLLKTIFELITGLKKPQTITLIIELQNREE